MEEVDEEPTDIGKDAHHAVTGRVTGEDALLKPEVEHHLAVVPQLHDSSPLVSSSDCPVLRAAALAIVPWHDCHLRYHE